MAACRGTLHGWCPRAAHASTSTRTRCGMLHSGAVRRRRTAPPSGVAMSPGHASIGGPTAHPTSAGFGSRRVVGECLRGGDAMVRKLRPCAAGPSPPAREGQTAVEPHRIGVISTTFCACGAPGWIAHSDPKTSRDWGLSHSALSPKSGPWRPSHRERLGRPTASVGEVALCAQTRLLWRSGCEMWPFPDRRATRIHRSLAFSHHFQPQHPGWPQASSQHPACVFAFCQQLAHFDDLGWRSRGEASLMVRQLRQESRVRHVWSTAEPHRAWWKLRAS